MRDVSVFTYSQVDSASSNSSGCNSSGSGSVVERLTFCLHPAGNVAPMAPVLIVVASVAVVARLWSDFCAPARQAYGSIAGPDIWTRTIHCICQTFQCQLLATSDHLLCHVYVLPLVLFVAACLVDVHTKPIEVACVQFVLGCDGQPSVAGHS